MKIKWSVKHKEDANPFLSTFKQADQQTGNTKQMKKKDEKKEMDAKKC